MKKNFLIIAAMSISIAGFAQKDEIKSATKALKGGDTAAAKTALEGAASSITSAEAKLQAQYYVLKGDVYADLAKKGDATAFTTAIDAYKMVISVEEASGKQKYTADASSKLTLMSQELVNAAVDDNNNQDFLAAAKKLYMSYKLSPKDTVYLYYAASSAVNGKDFPEALKYYEELNDVKYDGSSMEYTAVNIASGERETMSKSQRDLMIKSGTYNDPKDSKSDSKRGEIIKNIALIYTQLGQDDKALNAYKEARKAYPEDVNLILNEANLYFKLGDKETFKSLMNDATQVAPDNPDLFYNIGVINMEQENIEEARAAFIKTLELDPGYVNAQLNLSTTFVNEGNGLIDTMNALGSSRADIAKYDALKKQKDGLFLKAAKVLEDALKLNPDNQGLLSQLKNIYGALGDNENFMRVKKLLNE